MNKTEFSQESKAIVTAKLVDPSQETFDAAAAALQDGKLVAFPTETVYGLGADATNDTAVASIFEAKGRPSFNPLIVHVADLDHARRFADISPLGEKLAAAFWPGGLTLVLKRRPDCVLSLLVSAGLDTVALRVPNHPIAQRLIASSGCAIAAPSANPSGKLSPTHATHVVEGLSDREELAYIIDGGPCSLGVESTVIGLPEGGPATLLRPGAVARAEIEAHLGAPLAEPAAQGATDGRSSPGMLASHYAPDAPLRLDAETVPKGGLLLGFGNTPDATANLSSTGDLKEAAANLFAMLRALDMQADGRPIAVSPIPNEGLGEAINDRLKRAAAPRD